MLDLSLFFGDANAWLAYAGATGQPVPAPQPQPQTYVQPSVQPSGTTYIVQPGDTLSEIAQRFGTTYQSLAAINNIPDPNRIYPGQEIVIDGAATEAPAASAVYYTIKPGDTLSGIAAKFDTTWQWLAQINGINDPDLIYPGNSIRVS